MEKGITQGPLINEKAAEKVQKLVADAVQKGAKVVMGGEIIPESTLYKPTILTGIKPEMDISQEEIFGPVVAIQQFTDEAEVVRQANDTRFGLAGR
jgi:succinate-semialdehyde dehydrogenase/glutarate-semialdehyde dehydrogenase